MKTAHRSNQIFLDAWDAMSRDCKGFERHAAGPFEVSWSGQPAGFFNMALTARCPESLAAFEAALTGLVSWTAERQQPWILSVCHEIIGAMLPEVEASLAAAGFGAMMPLTGMEATTLHPAARGCPDCSRLTEAHAGIGSKALRVNEAG